MGLDLDIVKVAGRGRAPVPVHVEVVREITEADLELMATANMQSGPDPIKRVTDRHHSLARLLASGVGEGEAATIVGYDRSRVSILKNSPAFRELLDLYRGEVKREFVSVLDHMAGMSRDALLELRNRLDDNPDRFSNKDLKELVTEFTDRTVDERQPAGDLPDIIELTAPSHRPVPAADESEEASVRSTD